jgi:hypothetical protein
MKKMEKNLGLMVTINNDIVENTESLKHDFGNGVPEGAERYLQDFFANNPKFDDSQEQFDAHIEFVIQLFNQYIV